jgi:hypothetical protein
MCALFLTCLIPVFSSAQKYSRVEAGIGTDSQTYSDFNGHHYLSTGINGVVDYNLSPSLAIEGNFSYLPIFQKTRSVDSGDELTAFGGMKMGWRGRHFGLYGKIEPGLASFSCGFSYFGPNGQPYYNCMRRTHFALQYGGVAEYNFTQHTFLRVDAAQSLITEFDQVLLRSGNLTYSVKGHIAQHFNFRFALQHSFGSLHDTESETVPRSSSFDAGVLYALQTKEHLDGVQPDSGIGLWLSWNFSRYVSWDTGVFDFPKDDHTAGFQDGGPAFEGVLRNQGRDPAWFNWHIC